MPLDAPLPQPQPSSWSSQVATPTSSCWEEEAPPSSHLPPILISAGKPTNLLQMEARSTSELQQSSEMQRIVGLMSWLQLAASMIEAAGLVPGILLSAPPSEEPVCGQQVSRQHSSSPNDLFPENIPVAQTLTTSAFQLPADRSDLQLQTSISETFHYLRITQIFLESCQL